MTRTLLLAALVWTGAAFAAAEQQPAPQQKLDIPALQVREVRILQEGEPKFSAAYAEFSKLLAQNPERGTPARTRLQQLAVQLEDSAGELRSRYEFASRYPPNKDELAKLKRPWEKFLSERTPAVRDLIREGRELARAAPGAPIRGPAVPQAQADFDLEKLSRETGVPLGPPVSRSGAEAAPAPSQPKPQASALPPPPNPQASVPPPPPPGSPPPAPPASSSGNVYFAVLTSAYRTADAEWAVPECRFREVAKTRTNYGSRTEAEGDAARLRSQGHADTEARYFDTYQRMDEFMRDWAQRRASDSRRCTEAFAAAKQRPGVAR